MSSLTPLGAPFIELPTVESTNNYAMGLVHEAMARHGMAVFAHEQTKGKGQRNRNWYSEPSLNIALSVIIEPQPPFGASNVFLLSKTVACAVAAFVNKFAKDAVRIKWPNDIYWRDRKAAGILIENVWQGSEWKFAVAGIGVNVNQTVFGDLGQRPVSLKQITGSDYRPAVLARELCHCLERYYRTAINDPSKILEEYQSLLYGKGEKMHFKNGSRVFEAEVRDVDFEGNLILFHTMEEKFAVGELEWIQGQ